jgi:ATP-binding cassette subfamily B protein
VFYSLIVGSAFGTLSEVIGELQRAAGAAERIAELLAAQSAILRRARPSAWQAGAPVGHRAARGALRLPVAPGGGRRRRPEPDHQPGQTVALVGPSGPASRPCSTCCCASTTPRAAASCSMASRSPAWMAELRRQFALVAQQPALFRGTVEANIRYGRPEASQAEVEAAARSAHAHEFIAHCRRVTRPTWGGWHRFVRRPAPAPGDCPGAAGGCADPAAGRATSALDAQSEHLIQQALPQLMAGRTTLVIAHRLATVQHADRIAVIDQGRLVAVGTHRQLIEESPLYARLAALQFTNG